MLDRDQLRLYTLIWQRTVATQMAEARFDQVGVDIEAIAGDARYVLRATGQTLVFDGFLKLYREGRDDEPDEDAESRLPVLTAEQALRMLEVLPEQHFTQPPPRFTEASLVKKLEELGIGRPSTYASIISTIQDRGYVRLEDKRFRPEDVGIVVTDKLVEHFPDIVDVNFTAYMEKELDDIAEGQLRKVQMLAEFNGPFERALEKAEDAFERYSEELDELCPLCPQEGRVPAKLQVKLGRYGRFIGCPNYPDCRYIRNMDGTERAEPEMLDERCPECGRQLQRRVGRFGPFVGCSGYPDCRFVQKDPAALDRRDVPAVPPGRAGPEADAVRRVLRLRPVSGVRPGREQPAREGPPLPRVRLDPAPPPEVAPVLELRRRAGSGVHRHEVGRRRGRGRGPPREGGGARGAGGREGRQDREVRREEDDEEDRDEEEDRRPEDRDARRREEALDRVQGVGIAGVDGRGGGRRPPRDALRRPSRIS